MNGSHGVKQALSVTALSFALTGYLLLAGTSANDASAVTVYEFSKRVLDHWYRIANTLSVPVAHTKPGALEPVVPKSFGALELIIFGEGIVTPSYKNAYQSLHFPNMIDQVHIATNEQKTLNYHVGGLKLIGVEDNGGDQGAVFFVDPPAPLIEYMNRKYDHQPMTGTGDGEGQVRYDRLKDGRYVLGVFLPYDPDRPVSKQLSH